MNGNGGIKGLKNTPGVSTTVGIWDTFDQNNNSEYWPKTPKINSINMGTNLVENQLYSITVTGQDFTSNRGMYWEVIHNTTDNSYFVSNSGFFTIVSSNQQGNFSLITNFVGNLSRPSVSFTLRLRFDNSLGPIVFESVHNILTPVLTGYSLSNTNEGSDMNLNIAYASVGSYNANYHSFVWSGTALAQSDYQLINGGNVTSFLNLTVPVYSDLTTEGNESIQVTVNNGYQSLGTISATIYDTSTTPNITSVTPSSDPASENQTVTFTVTDSNSQQSGTLYYTINGIQAADVSGGSLSGEFTLSGGSGTFDVSLIGDGVTENESFSVSIRTDSISGPIIAGSSTISITDQAVPLGEPLNTAFYSIAEFVNADGASDTSSNYSVSEIASSYSGTGSLYLIHKATGATTYYNDVPIACIQVLAPGGGSVTEQWWFGTSGNGQGWTTDISQYNWGLVGAGINITPATAATYSYTTSVVNGTTANRFTLATSTGSVSTGAVDGIAQPTGPMPLGEKTIAQSLNTYYMYRETSGASVGYSSICRSPSRTWTAGEVIRIAYIIGNISTANYYNPTDTLFVGIA